MDQKREVRAGRSTLHHKVMVRAHCSAASQTQPLETRGGEVELERWKTKGVREESKCRLSPLTKSL